MRIRFLPVAWRRSDQWRAWRHPHQWALIVVTVWVLAVGVVVDGWLTYGWQATATRPPPNATPPPDATVFIGTLILIFTVFLTVFATVSPKLVGMKAGPWIVFMYVLIAFAVGADMYRILNSVGDLYVATNELLEPPKVEDAFHEFVYYWFIPNVVVIGLLMVTLGLGRKPEKARGEGKESARPFDLSMTTSEPNSNASERKSLT